MPYDLNACGLVTICGLRVNHNGGNFFTCFHNENEINHFTSAGCSTTMYLNWIGGDVSIARNTIYAKNTGNIGIGNTTPCAALDIYQAGLGTTGTGNVLSLRGGNNSTLYGTNQIVFNYGGGAGSNSYAHALKSRHQLPTH